ncbi:hypothetical protein HRG_011032 [Hirsutella rhossiliensis]|uniref:Helix-turn-helix domain-containing protein n=1 Tax=Hirsutella rhossiliensis TaxID=111463 RepID=A0A9P8MMV9_9HYPO|nr:uncharacterized protein HRG_11032 [Hirsutella rhossiliensis]KAH0957939.1 hypothetical protein HRG_11032 [Hirsutella rhossiliensis]
MAAIAIRTDADFVSGDFSRRLHSMGIVQPNPTFSPSSQAASPPSPSAATAPLFPAASNNATLSVLEARRLLEQQAAEDLEKLGRRDSPGRRFLDMRTMVDAVEMRYRGTPNSVIERRLGLECGIMDKLGPLSILSHLSTRQ